MHKGQRVTDEQNLRRTPAHPRRVGAGWPMVLTWGGSIGYRQRWGPHELRTGLHLTNLVLPFPVSSGAEAIYLRRYESFSLESGVRINAFPTSLTAFIGLKF